MVHIQTCETQLVFLHIFPTIFQCVLEEIVAVVDVMAVFLAAEARSFLALSLCAFLVLSVTTCPRLFG